MLIARLKLTEVGCVFSSSDVQLDRLYMDYYHLHLTWDLSYLSFRCSNATQILEYESYIRKLENANDNGIFGLTGCLSKCHKYKYNARSLGIVQKNNEGTTGQTIPPNTIQLMFMHPTTEHEVREQV